MVHLIILQEHNYLPQLSDSSVEPEKYEWKWDSNKPGSPINHEQDSVHWLVTLVGPSPQLNSSQF